MELTAEDIASPLWQKIKKYYDGRRMTLLNQLPSLVSKHPIERSLEQVGRISEVDDLLALDAKGLVV